MACFTSSTKLFFERELSELKIPAAAIEQGLAYSFWLP